MVGVGLVLDAPLYHRLLPYQPGWVALPLGAARARPDVALAPALELDAPSGPRSHFFAGAWLVVRSSPTPASRSSASPRPRTAASSAGRPGALRRGAGGARRGAGVAWAVEPPTVTSHAGVHQGPLVLDHAQTLVGEPGAVVRGGIVVTADDVTIRNVTVAAGRTGSPSTAPRASSWTASSSRAPSWTGSTSAAASSRSATARSARCPAPYPGDRHLVRLRPAAEPRRGLHDHRRP